MSLLEYHIHTILLNCTTIPLGRNYHPYFTAEKNEAQKGEKFSHHSVIQWNSKSGLSGYGGGAGPAHFPSIIVGALGNLSAYGSVSANEQ